MPPRGKVRYNDQMQRPEKTLKQATSTPQGHDARGYSAAADGVYNSPRLVAQRQQLHRIFGPAVQRKVGFEIEVIPDRIKVAKPKLGAQPRTLAKGEVLHQDNGWKLTPDSRDEDGTWTPEYIVAAIDETTDPDAIPAALDAVADHTRSLSRPDRWSNGAGLRHTDHGSSQDRVGNFHVTGGLRLSRLSQLIKLLNPGSDPSHPDSEEAKVATRAEGTHVFDENYKNVVALISVQIHDLMSHKVRDDDSAKMGVSILSRTDLGAVVGKVKGFKFKSTFIADVLAASNAKEDDLLFRHQLPGSQVTGRSIDDQQQLTVREWLDKLWEGADYVWSQTTDDQGGRFPMERVGPSTLGHRAEGVILELRSLEEQGMYSPRVNAWPGVGRKYAMIFRMLNEKKSNPDILRALIAAKLV